jgi:hypothetical protein
MTDYGKQTRDAGSAGIPQRDSTGITGSSREVSNTDQAVPGTERTGLADEELAWVRKHVPGHGTASRPAKSVFRKTQLLGIAPPIEPDAIKKARRRTLKSIRDPGGTIAYRPFEDMFRNFVCSLVERQDRIYDEMLLHVADLQQQIDALACRIEEIRHASPAEPEAKG